MEADTQRPAPLPSTRKAVSPAEAAGVVVKAAQHLSSLPTCACVRGALKRVRRADALLHCCIPHSLRAAVETARANARSASSALEKREAEAASGDAAVAAASAEEDDARRQFEVVRAAYRALRCDLAA